MLMHPGRVGNNPAANTATADKGSDTRRAPPLRNNDSATLPQDAERAHKPLKRGST
jgi:hypothetical protein